MQSLKLLGDRQLQFLNHCTSDWKDTDMKVLLSQTIFANNVTHYGPTKVVLGSDLDSGGCPKTINVFDNFNAQKLLKLPELKIEGTKDVAVDIRNQSGELVNAIRIKGAIFTLRAVEPSEQNNLANENPEKVKELSALIKQMHADTDAKFPTLNPAYKANK